MAGRKRKPTALRILHGDEERKINRNQPTPPPVVSVDPPTWLGAGPAADKWREIVPRLIAMGLYASVHEDAVARYCATHERYVAAYAACHAGDDVLHYRDEDGSAYSSQVSPHFTIMMQCGKQLDRLAGEFGMTPAAIAKLTAPNAQKNNDPIGTWLAANA